MALVGQCKDLVIRLVSLEQGVGFCDAGDHRLFAEDVFAGIHCRIHLIKVLGVRGDDLNSIDILAGQQLFVVCRLERIFKIRIGLFCECDLAWIDVAEGGDLHTLDVFQLAHVVACHPTGPNDANAYLFAHGFPRAAQRAAVPG